LELHEHLAYMDYRGITNLARIVLDFLDALGAEYLGLESLLMAETKIDSWPVDPEIAAPGRPAGRFAGAGIPTVFRQLDSAHMLISGAPLGSAVIMGVSAARRRAPRAPCEVAERPQRRWQEPLLRKPINLQIARTS
jgi:hypothetical protein